MTTGQTSNVFSFGNNNDAQTSQGIVLFAFFKSILPFLFGANNSTCNFLLQVALELVLPINSKYLFPIQ